MQITFETTQQSNWDPNGLGRVAFRNRTEKEN